MSTSLAIGIGLLLGKASKPIMERRETVKLMQAPHLLSLEDQKQLQLSILKHGTYPSIYKAMLANLEQLSIKDQQLFLLTTYQSFVNAGSPAPTELIDKILSIFKQLDHNILKIQWTVNLLQASKSGTEHSPLTAGIALAIKEDLQTMSHNDAADWIYHLNQGEHSEKEMLLQTYWDRINNLKGIDWHNVYNLLNFENVWNTHNVPGYLYTKNIMINAEIGFSDAPNALWRHKDILDSERIDTVITACIKSPLPEAHFNSALLAARAQQNGFEGDWLQTLYYIATRDDYETLLAVSPDTENPAQVIAQHIEQIRWYTWTLIALLEPTKDDMDWINTPSDMSPGVCNAYLYAWAQADPESACEWAKNQLHSPFYGPGATAIIAAHPTKENRALLRHILTSKKYPIACTIRAATLLPGELSEEDKEALRTCIDWSFSDRDRKNINILCAALWRLGDIAAMPFVSDIDDFYKCYLATLEGIGPNQLPSDAHLPALPSESSILIHLAILRATQDQTLAQEQANILRTTTGPIQSTLAVIAAESITGKPLTELANDWLSSPNPEIRYAGYHLTALKNLYPQRLTFGLHPYGFAVGIAPIVEAYDEITYQNLDTFTDEQLIDRGASYVDTLMDNMLRFEHEHPGDFSLAKLAAYIRLNDGMESSNILLTPKAPKHILLSLGLAYDTENTLELLLGKNTLSETYINRYEWITHNRWWFIIEPHLDEECPRMHIWADENQVANELARIRLWWQIHH